LSEEYGSFDIEKKTEKTEKLEISAITNPDITARNIANFALITAIKIITRINNANLIERKKLNLTISMHKGKLNYFIVNSTQRIEIATVSNDLNTALYNNVSIILNTPANREEIRNAHYFFR
jgi:hypothetical protein